MRNKTNFRAALLFGAALVAQVGVWTDAAAARDLRLPKHYPDKFQRIGVLGYNVSDARFVVIGDHGYTLAKDVKVAAPYSPRGSLHDLAKNRRVGFTVVGEGGGQNGTITEIWVLPQGVKGDVDEPSRTRVISER